jgi:chaperonin cofactor prefoldin
MTTQTDSDLVGRLEALETRVRTLEDTDEIRNLKARYAELCAMANADIKSAVPG